MKAMDPLRTMDTQHRALGSELSAQDGGSKRTLELGA